MPIIYSTAPAGAYYAKYNDVHPNDVNGDNPLTIQRQVLIKGGAGIYNENTGETPIVIKTEVTDEEVEFLKTIPIFNQHVEGGFLSIVYDKKATDNEVTSDMNQENGSLPLTEKKLKLKKNGRGETATYDLPDVEEIEEQNIAANKK